MKKNRGFTLIEIIITITLIAISAALFVAYVGSVSFTQSPASSGMVAKQYALIQEMEIITSHYRQEISNGTLNLTNFETYVDGNTYIHSSDLTTLTNGTYTTQQVLVVTLKNEDQTVTSIFTE